MTVVVGRTITVVVVVEFPPLDELRDKWAEDKMPEHDWQDDLDDWQPRSPEEDPSITVKKAEDMPAKPQQKDNGNGHRRRTVGF